MNHENARAYKHTCVNMVVRGDQATDTGSPSNTYTHSHTQAHSRSLTHTHRSLLLRVINVRASGIRLQRENRRSSIIVLENRRAHKLTRTGDCICVETHRTRAHPHSLRCIRTQPTVSHSIWHIGAAETLESVMIVHRSDHLLSVDMMSWWLWRFSSSIFTLPACIERGELAHLTAIACEWHVSRMLMVWVTWTMKNRLPLTMDGILRGCETKWSVLNTSVERIRQVHAHSRTHTHTHTCPYSTHAVHMHTDRIG